MCLHFVGSLQTKKQKLFLMSWCPDTAKIKKKMLYSSSFDALKQALEGVGKYIQVRERIILAVVMFVEFYYPG